jgi:hypothetical protein
MRRVVVNAILAVIIAVTTSAQAPPSSWTVDVTSRGGFVARESRRVVDWNGNLRIDGCRFTLTNFERTVIEKTVARAQPQQWEAGYGLDQTCCDLVTYDVVLSRTERDGRRSTFHSSWIVGAPDDLVALTRAVLQVPRAECKPAS